MAPHPAKSLKLALAFAGIGFVLASASCSGKGKGQSVASDSAPPNPTLTIFYTGELKGQIEPCGCTTDPLGDLARTVKLVATAAASGAVMHLDSGSTLFSNNPIPESMKTQETLKADLIVDVFSKQTNVAAAGLGQFDLALGADAVRPARHAVNVPADAGIALAEPMLVDKGAMKIGVFGVSDPEPLEAAGIAATAPAAAASKAIADLRKRGADVVVAIANMTRTDAASLAREAPGADLILVGRNLPEPKQVSKRATKVGSSWIIEPANRGQVVSRIDITWRGGSGLSDAKGPSHVSLIRDRIAALQADLERFKSDAQADKSFVALKEKELSALRSELAAAEQQPIQPPPKGSYFVLEQIDIERQLACAPSVVAAKQSYDRAAATANLAAAQSEKPKPVPEGKAGYVGGEECSYCHESQTEFWQKTRHAGAWKTLTDVGKEYNLDCIYCHVTGFDKPGGSTLAVNEHLRDIQCETCHGPGSLHVEAGGGAKAIQRSPAKALCTTCHNELHSDTFDYEAYLRDVTGPGHGAEFRASLGEGPTGRELREAGLKKAGAGIGEGCPK